MIKVEAICDSINPQGTRLITMLLKYPKFLHQETLRHRTLYIHDCLYDPDFSFSVSSARAIPFSKLIDEVESDELRASPLVWGAEQRGMSPGDELDPEAKQVAQLWWKRAALDASKNVRAMAKGQGLLEAMPWQIPHKSIVNRIIEPYIHVNCLTTGTTRGWMNFFGLRLDKAADPTLQILAQEAWKIWNESKPQLLQPDQWHLPYIDEDEILWLKDPYLELSLQQKNNLFIKVSVARCARLSYLSFETSKRSTIKEDLKLYDRLLGGPIKHVSPAEHQATPDEPGIWSQDLKKFINNLDSSFNKEILKNSLPEFKHHYQSGNLGPGWRQYRKMLANESVAPLPLEYQTN